MEECDDDLENLLSRCLHSVRVTDNELANKGVKQSQQQIRAKEDRREKESDWGAVLASNGLSEPRPKG